MTQEDRTKLVEYTESCMNKPRNKLVFISLLSISQQSEFFGWCFFLPFIMLVTISYFFNLVPRGSDSFAQHQVSLTFLNAPCKRTQHYGQHATPNNVASCLHGSSIHTDFWTGLSNLQTAVLTSEQEWMCVVMTNEFCSLGVLIYIKYINIFGLHEESFQITWSTNQKVT